MKLQSLLHFRTDIKDKLPLSNDIELGEIAINHATDGETLFIKNNDDKIAEFKDTKYYSKITDDIYSKLDTIDKTIEDNEFVVATTLTYLDGKVTDVIQTIEENELVTATALTDLDNRLLEVENGGVGNEGTITGVSVNGTSIATSGVANIPAASTSAYGVTKLTTATTSTSTTLAATASAVKAAYDLANSYKGTVTEVKANGTSIATSGVANIPAASTSAYGVTKLTSATNSTSTTLAATASAVKAAYDLANSYKGTVTGVKINGTNKTPTSGVVDLGTVITEHQDISHLATKEEVEELTNEVIDNEFVVATTLTYLDEKVTDVMQTIEENELVTATALTDLDNRVTLVESGSGAYSEVNHGTADTTFTLTPNTFHVWDEVTSLTLDFGSETSGVANEYLFQFTSGPDATSLTLPDDIKWANDNAPTIEANMIYQVSVLKGLASVLEFKVPIQLIENKITATLANRQVTFSSQYPVASDIAIAYNIDGMSTLTTIMNAGLSEITVSTGVVIEINIVSISPMQDGTYNYTF